MHFLHLKNNFVPALTRLDQAFTELTAIDDSGALSEVSSLDHPGSAVVWLYRVANVVGMGQSEPRSLEALLAWRGGDPRQWQGLNLLGFALMEVRAQLGN